MSRYIEAGHNGVSKDGYSFKLIERKEDSFVVKFDIDGSIKKYKGRFSSNRVIYSTNGNSIYNVGYKGVSKDGYNYELVEKNSSSFIVVFEDRTIKKYNSSFAKDLVVYKESLKIKVGYKGVSKDGYKYEIIQNESDFFKVRFEDKKEKVYKKVDGVISLSKIRYNGRNEGYRKYDINYRGISVDGYEYTIVERDADSTTVRFDIDGSKKTYKGYFSKKDIRYRKSERYKEGDRGFSVEGYEYTVIRVDDKYVEVQFLRDNKVKKYSRRFYGQIRYKDERANYKVGDERVFGYFGLCTIIDISDKFIKIKDKSSNIILLRRNGRGIVLNISDYERICNFKINYVVGYNSSKESFRPCRCNYCGMSDILTIEEIVEHWRECGKLK